MPCALKYSENNGGSNRLRDVNDGGSNRLGFGVRNGEFSTPDNARYGMSSSYTSLVKRGMDAYSTLCKTVNFNEVAKRLWNTNRNKEEGENENDNISFNGGGRDVDMDDDDDDMDDDTSPPSTPPTSCSCCGGGVCNNVTVASTAINYESPNQPTLSDIENTKQMLIPKEVLHLISGLEGIDIETDEEGVAKLKSGLLAEILDEFLHEPLRSDRNKVSSDEKEEEVLFEEENGNGDTSTVAGATSLPSTAVYINGVDVSSLASKQEVALVCNTSNILVLGCNIGGGKHPSPKMWRDILGIINELYNEEDTYYSEWNGGGNVCGRKNLFDYDNNGVVDFLDVSGIFLIVKFHFSHYSNYASSYFIHRKLFGKPRKEVWNLLAGTRIMELFP